MNIQIEKLCDKYYLSPKDRYEINQIYNLLPDHKKQNLINNFPQLAQKFYEIEEEIRIEREILIWDAIGKIQNVITLVQNEKKY